MGKKGKKGKAKKEGKAAKKKEPEITFKEAILAYQINIIEKKLEDVNYEIRGWEEKNKRASDRNAKLKSEQQLLVKNLLRQAKDANNKTAEADVDLKEKEDVVNTMKSGWKSQRDWQSETEELQSRIHHLDHDIDSEKRQVAYWTDYQNYGHKEHKKQIEVLQQELRDLNMSFESMAGHLQRELDKVKGDIKKYTDITLEKQTDLASEKAISQLDKYSRQEVLDNDWLKREVELHRVDTDKLKRSVAGIEQDNLNVMSMLFECKVDDLSISRKFYLSQVDTDDNLEKGLLQMDLENIASSGRETSAALERKANEAKAVRPKSATLRAIENKVFPLLAPHEGDDEDDEDDISDHNGGEDELNDSAQLDILDDFFITEEVEEYLQLGPLELKLLNVTGVSKPLHEPQELTKEEIKVKDCQPDKWPVTPNMMNSTLSAGSN